MCPPAGTLTGEAWCVQRWFLRGLAWCMRDIEERAHGASGGLRAGYPARNAMLVHNKRVIRPDGDPQGCPIRSCQRV